MHRRDRKNRPIAAPRLKAVAFHLTCAFVAAQAAMPNAGWAQSIIPDGRTATTVGTIGNVTDIHTTTRRGANAFNSFHTFNVDAGHVANLHLPDNAANLINLVRDERTTIDGMLNAIRDGSIGGNVYFANPHGFIVSSGGVVNVGNLHVSTPTQGFVDDFFTAPGAPDDAAVALLLSGNAPRNAGGVVTIDGRVNAVDGVSLSAGAIKVGGAIYSGARFVSVEPEFTDVVNANGLTSGTRIVEREGRIQIVADTHIGISGVVSVDGSAGVDGGEVTMRAGGNITLHESALVTARGVGADSSGGTVNIWADHSAVAHRGALVDASAGDSGDGGFIEFSARDTVELAGGEFRADGHDGAAGSILIDPDHIVVSAHILRDGANYSNVPSGGTVASASLTLLADESITVSENIVISSRQVAGSDANAHRNEASTGQSGSLTLDAPDIVLGSGSAILAHGSNGHAGGDVRLQAHRTGGLLDVFSDTTAGISLTHATITGRNIDLSASAAHDSTFSPIVTKTVSARIDIDSSALIASGSLTIGAASDVNAVTPDFSPLGTIDVASVAAVDVHGNSQLSSGTDTHLSADSSVTAKALPGLPDFGELPGDAGVAIAIVDSQATVDLRDASTVDATGALDLVATNTVDVEAIADASASASTSVGGAVAVAVVDTTTRAAILDSAGVTHADAVTLAAESSNHIVASATAAAGGAAEKGTEQSKSEETLADYRDEASTSDGGVTVAAAVAVSDLTSTTEAKLESDGEVNASGTVTVGTKALNQSKVSADGSSSDGGVGVGVGVALNLARLNNHATVAQTVNAGGLTVEAQLPDGDAINRFTTSATSGAAASNVGVAGALAVSVIDNRTSARLVGPAPVGIGGGNLRLDTRNHSEVDVEAKPAEGSTSGDSVGLGASVALHVASNETLAEISDGAVANDLGNVTLSADGRHGANVGAEAGAEGGIGLTPVVAIAVTDNVTTARVGSGATLALSGDFSAEAIHSGTTMTSASADAAGDKAAIGAAVAVTVASDTVTASTARAIESSGGGIAFAAHGDATSSAAAKASAKGGQEDEDGDTQDDGVDQEIGKQLSLGKDKQTAGSNNEDQQPASAETAGDGEDGGTSKLSVAAAIAVNVASATAEASVSDGQDMAAGGGELKLSASGNTDASASADGSATGDSAVGIGAAVAINTASSATGARLGSGIHTAEGVTVEALMTDTGDTTHTAGAEAKSGGGSSKVGIAGSLALNIVDNSSIAAIASGAAVNAGGGNVTLAAANASENTARAVPSEDATASGEQVGIGASVAVNVVANESRAELADGATLIGGRHLAVMASGAHEAATEAEAGAEGGVAVTPVAAVTVIDNQTTARLGSGNGLDLAGGAEVEARHSSTITTRAKGSSQGEKAAVGIAVAVTIANDSAVATTARDITAGGDVRFAALTSQSTTTTASASAKGGKEEKKDGEADDTPDDGVDREVGKQAAFGQDKQKDGSDNKTQQPASAESSEGKVSVAAAVAVNVAESRAEAYVPDGITLDTTGSLTVEASGNTDAGAHSDGSAAGSTATVGIGAAVSVNSATTHTRAWIGNADITANGLTLRAFMSDVAGDTVNTFATSAKAGAGGGKVGIAGALALNLIETHTTAEIHGGASVNADGGDVELSAESESVTSATALPDEPASGGKVGVGASVALNLFREELVRARIRQDAEVTDANNIRVAASARSDTVAEAQAGAAGSIAVDAVVALSELRLVTEAVIESGEAIEATGSVELSATSSGAHDATATGDVKSDKVGVGASAAIIISNTSTRAALERDLTTGIDPDDHLTIAASGTRTYEAVASASAGGGKDDDSLSQSEKDNAKSTSTLKENESAQQGTESSGSGSKVNVAAAAGVLVVDDDVSATIASGRTIASGGDLSVTAFNSSDFSARGLGDTLDVTKLTSGSEVGIGVGVGLSILRNDTIASIGADSHIVRAGDISVQAESRQNTSPEFALKLAAEGVAGAGSEKVSVAGALAVANSNATTRASIGDNVIIDDAGAITIASDNTSKLAAKAWSAATSGKVGIGASIAILVSENEYQAWLGEGADVTATSLTVAARNHKVTGPVSFDWSLDGLEERFTEANLQILLGQNNYYTETIAGAGSNKVAVTGAFSVNVFDDTTEAWIGNAAAVTTVGAVDLAARNETTAKAFAGGVSAAGKVGVGVASADIVNSSATRAWLGNNAGILQAGSVTLGATGYMDLAVIAASAAGAGTAGVGGVLSLVHSESVVEAYADDDTHITSDGTLAISATNTLEALNVAGVASVGGTAGVGVSSGITLIDNQTRASIGRNAEASAAALASVDAISNADVLSVVVGGAGGGTAGVAASGAVNVHNPVTRAWIDEDARINATDPLVAQGLRVSADATTELLSIVGTVGIGGTAGVGGAADVIVVDKTTQAWIARGSEVRTAGDLGILADSSEKIRSVGVGFSAGGTAGVQGSASVLVLTTDTQAYAADQTTLYSAGNLVIAAAGASELDLLSGAIGAAGTAAVGAGAAVSVVDKTTHAWIGEDANVTALGNSAAIDVATGEFGVTYSDEAAAEGEVAAPDVTPSNGEQDLSGGSAALNSKRTATGTTRSLQGLAVTAVNQDDIKGFAVTGAASGTASVTLSGEVSVHSTDTKAWIGNATRVNEDNTGAEARQSVLVAAGNDSFHLGIAGALSASGTVGVGVGADVAVMNHDTHAWIGDATVANARKDITVLASSTQEVLSISASLGASGTVGVSGSVSVLSFDNSTWAWIGDGAAVDAGGNVAVNAVDDTATTMIAGTVALGLGGGGVGGGVGVTLIDKDTRAWVGDGTSVDARGQNTDDLTAFSGDGFGATTTMRGLQVQALSSEDLFTISAAGAGGLYVGIAGAVSVATVDSDTLAFLGNGVRVNTGGGGHANQDVNVTARNDFNLFNVSGALGVGAAGIAGAVDVGVIRNDTTAFIGDDAIVNTARDVDVNALAGKDVETYVVSASGGLAAIAAGVAVYSVGGGLDSDSQDRLKGDDGDTTGDYADRQVTDASITDGFLADYDDERIRSASDDVRAARAGTAVSAAFTATETRTLPAGNAAFIGTNASIDAGRHVDLDVRENVDFDMLTGALSIGAVGLGAGVGVATFHNDNTVFIDEGTTVTAGAAGNVNLNAQLVENIGALGIAGTGGIVAVDAAVAILHSSGSVTAVIGDDVAIDRADLIRVEADDERNLEAETTGVSVGAVAAGASISTATISGTTSATLGDNVQIGQDALQVGGLEVDAGAKHAASAKALAAKGGLGLAASGTVSTATVDPTVSASIGAGSRIDVNDTVAVTADAATAAHAEALGINVSLNASLGASIATATASPQVTASLGSGTVVDAAAISVQARQSIPTSGRSAFAAATGASGGLLLGANATWSEAVNSGQVHALVGNGSTLTASGAVTVAASNVNSQLADVAGLSGGLIAVGANFAHARSDTLTEAVLGDLVKVAADSLELAAIGSSTNHAHGVAGSGGVASVPFSEASTATISQTYARTGGGNNAVGNARKIDVGTLLVTAHQTSEFDSWMRSTNASLVGVSGAKATNDANARTEAHIGTGGYVEADTIVMQAGNTMRKRPPTSATIPSTSISVPTWNVNSGSGGLVDVPAAASTTDIVTNALTQVGAGAHLEQTGDRDAPGNYALDAWNDITATDKVKMASGGAVSAATGASLIRADISNATVRVGDFASLAGIGDIRLGARSIANLFAQTAVDVWGAVGVAPFGESLARFQGINTIEIGAADIQALNDIRLSAGASSGGVANQLATTARTDVFNNTAIPVNRDPVADAIIDTQSRITVANGADLGAVRHVTLYAEKGAATASGVGIGKDLYREALAEVGSAISNAFGGEDVSFETRTGRSIRNQTSSVTVDGNVRVGIHRKQLLEIGIDGTVTSQTDGISITDTGFKAIAADILDRIADLEDLIRQYSVDNPTADASIAVAAYRSEIRFLERKLDELGFPRAEGDTGGFTSVPGISPKQAAEEAVDAMTDTRSGYTTTRNALDAENTTLSNQNDALSTENTTLTATNATLIAQRDALDPDDDAAQIAALNTQINNNNGTIAANNDTISTNNTVISSNNTEISALDSRITNLTGQIVNIQTDLADGVYSDETIGGPIATFLTVSDTIARLGNIYVRGDQLGGSGTLDAPGDAEIRIINNGPSFLILKDLTIPPDEGGRLYFNSIDVQDNAQINSINRVHGGAAFAIHTAESQVDSSGDPLPPAKPQILVESRYDPLDPLYIAQTPPDTPTLAPDIILQGDVSNLRGLVKIDSAAGSIRLEQKRDADGNLIQPVETANIRADQVEIKTRNGDFVQSYTNTFFHTAGAPLTITPGDEELAFSGNIARINRSPEVPGAGIVANGSVLIAARYLNINGTVQSGISEWGVRIPAGASVTVPGLGSATFAQAQAHYNGLSSAEKAALGAEFYTVSGATVDGLAGNVQGNWEQVTVRYNARENRLELGGVQVQGGYIELFGQIFNTNGAGGGKLRVLDGYGQISIDNQTALPMWVNLLDTGRGVKGEINITNITGIDAQGVPIISTATFTRDPGGSRDGGYYDPTSGLRYVMTVGYDQVREDFYRYSQNGWFGTAILGDKVLDEYRINSITRENDPLSQGEFLGLWSGHTGTTHYQPLGSATYTPQQTIGPATIPGSITGGRQQTETTSSVLTPGRSWKDCNWWTLCANAKHYQEFTVTTGTKTTITDSVRGDYGIGIEYIGFDEGKVNVASAGNVVLNGSINNRNGDTAVNSAGSITQNGDLAILGGNNVNLAAGTGIGDNTQSLQINVKDGGRLDATSAAGALHIAQVVGDLRVGTVGGAGVSNVVLQSARDLLAFDADSLVQGRRIELIADNGAIGDLDGDSPLRISTGYTTNQAQWPNNGLMATARNDIYLRNVSDPANSATYTGDLLLIAVESLAGDVRIEAAGKAIDNNPYGTTDTRTEAELAELWDSLRLRGPGAVEKADEAVAAFENGKTNNYTLYWQFRARQADAGASYDPGFEYAVSQAERDALSAAGMNATQITEFAANRTAQYHQLHAEVGEFTTAYDSGFRYVASTEEESAIRQGSSWSDSQLILSVGAGLLKNITDTVTTIKEPNVIGRNITLLAGSDIGSFGDPLTIDLSAGLDTLTTAQKAALAAAERGDASVSGSIITIAQPRPVNVAVGTGALSATAGGLVFLGSEQDLRIDRITALGDSRIKTAGSLVNAASVFGAPNVTAASIILEAAAGGIGSMPDTDGTVSTPFLVNITSGSGIIARAASDIWLESGTDMLVDTMFSLTDIRIDALGSILDFHLGESAITPENNLRARNITLTSIGGSIGSADNALDAGVNADGAITATAGTFGQGIYLNGPAGENFNIASAISGDAVALSSATFMFIDGLVTGPGPITLVSADRMTLTPFADVHATTLGVFLRAGELLMEDAGDGVNAARMHVVVGMIDIGTTGDAIITGIYTGNPTESAIVINSGGGIYDGGDTRLDIIANTAPAATLTMTAVGPIGGNPLEIDVLFLNGMSQTGLIHLAALNSVEIGTLQAPGEIVLAAGGDITGNSVLSTGDQVALHSIGGNIDIATIQVDSGLFLSGRHVSAAVWGTGSAPIVGSMTGYGGSLASSIDVSLSSASGFRFTDVSTTSGSITMLLGDLWVSNFFVGDRFTVTNPQTRLLIDQHNLALQGFDVQLYPDGEIFSLGLSRNSVYTTAYLIDRRPTHEVITPRGNNMSVVEYTEQALSELRGAPPEDPEAEEDTDTVVAYSGFPVATDGDPCPDESIDLSCETE